MGNVITLESLLYGLMLGGTIAAVLMWLSCLHTVFTADKTVYLAGRIAPKLALFLAILLRLVPRIKAQWRRTAAARRGIGCGAGGLPERCKNRIRLFSGMVTWTLDSIVALSDAMRSRGAALKGRTAYSLYRFDHRDRMLVIVLFTLITLCMMASLLGQTRMQFDPMLHFSPMTAVSVVFFRRLGRALSSAPGNGSAGRIPISPRSATTTLKNGSQCIGAVSRFCYSDSRLTNSRNAFRLGFVLLGSQ